MFKSINPANGEVIAEFSPLNARDVDARLEAAHQGFVSWRQLSPRERGEFLIQLGRELRSQKENLAKLITSEMGKPIVEARTEVEKCALTCEFMGQQGHLWLQDQIQVDKDPSCFVSYQPLGTILGIMPWNFPLWQVIRFAAPTLIAGNTVVVKHAPNTWGSARELAACFWRAGFAQGVYQDLPIDVPTVEKVIADRRVAGVSITGSTRAGRSVAATAGQWLKKHVLELGGSDPYVLLDDADVAWAADKAVQARMQNGGQSCVAAKRFFVTRKNGEEFSARVLKRLEDFVPADPLLETTKLGPMARQDLRDSLHTQVKKAQAEGARIEVGGESPSGKGFFYPATLLTNIDADSIVHREEFFGPVAAIQVTDTEEEAIRMANHTSYGLGAAIFSRDEDRARRIARDQMDAGVCVVNGIVRSDPRWPFGGVKDSGIGRELSQFGTHEFVNVKSVIVDSRA
jgi:succinate-semialdehyde dehydrogenase / glutarate-semialdehyde dehydrogenase